MKLLANENIPLGMVHRLREMGHDVLAIVQTCPGVTDAVVLDLARREQRTLLTFDRDYGELVLAAARKRVNMAFSTRFWRARFDQGAV